MHDNRLLPFRAVSYLSLGEPTDGSSWILILRTLRIFRILRGSPGPAVCYYYL